jgi:ceramide kinase
VGAGQAAAAPASPERFVVAGADAEFTLPAATAASRYGEEWRLVEGEFLSVMLIVMPCLSDKTRHGMARYGHLADGRLKLVLVRRCSAVAYLRFLAGMSASGEPDSLQLAIRQPSTAAAGAPARPPHLPAAMPPARVPCDPAAHGTFKQLRARASARPAAGVFPGQHEAVEVIDAVAVRFKGGGSAWNLDGELAQAQVLAAEMHLGLVEVFARGIER